MAKPLTQERLKELLDYDPLTGVFRWRSNRGSRGRAGAIAGAPHNGGYVQIMIDKVNYLAHRLAVFYVHGAWPVVIDHKNRVRNDNKFDNLRPATHSKNGMNKGTQPNNTSGVPGVSWASNVKKWYAYINFGGKRKNLGWFEDKGEAIAARLAAQTVYFGEFARAA